MNPTMTRLLTAMVIFFAWDLAGAQETTLTAAPGATLSRADAQIQVYRGEDDLATPRSALAAAQTPYQYPFTNPYLATVAGTPEPLRGEIPPIKLKKRRLPIPEGRVIPEVLWYGRRLEYSFALQRGRQSAPLIFIIAGTGSAHNGGTNADLLKAFYGQGFHVVGISSPTHPNFVIAASETKVPGNMALDAQDLYHVMQRIEADLGKRLNPSEYHLAGYSLGGMQAAFVSKLDSQKQRFNFKRVLMINSPVSLYASISKLDRMLDNVPGGIDNFNRYFDGVVRQISDAYTRSTTVEFNQDLIYAAFKERPPTNEELAAVIGIAFRMAAANMVFTADVMTNFGFIKPKEVILARNTNLDDYLQVGLRVGLTDYFHEFFWPFYQSRYPNMTRQQFARAQSLEAIEDYLRNTPSIEVVHNQDDVILMGNQIDFFRRVFGNRVQIYPHGGHLGNIVQRDTLAHILGKFTSGRIGPDDQTLEAGSPR